MLKNKIDKYKIKEISKQLDIPIATLYRWIESPTKQQIKFVELLNYLEVDTSEYVKHYQCLKNK